MIRTFLFLLIITSIISFAHPKRTANAYGIITADISYSSAQKNSLDLYIPQKKNFPVILFIHGGSFVAGDRKEFPYAQIGETFQKLGIGCAVMSYRLMRDSVWPAQPRDVAKAIRWLKENVDSFGGDPTKIVIVGHSAGGHLAALVSTDSTYLHESGLSLKDIAGTVSMGAMMSDGGSLNDLTKEEELRLFQTDWFFKIFGSRLNFENSLPIRHVNPLMPKMLIVLADTERFDPPKERSVKEFIRVSAIEHIAIKYEILPRRTHMGTVEHMTDSNDLAVQMIVRFISGL